MKKLNFRYMVFILAMIFSFTLLGTTCLPVYAQSQVETARTLIDDAGRTVVLPAKVQKLVVPNNWILSMVFALRARDIVVGSSVGVTRDSGFNAVYPDWIKKLTVVGDVSNLNKETILKLETDVVLTQPGPNVTQMESIGIPIVAMSRSKSAEENILLIGKVLGKEKEAQELADFYTSKIDFVKSRTADIPVQSRKKIYFVAGPTVTKTYGKNLGHGNYYQWAGGSLISDILDGSDISTIDVSQEQIIAWNPDLVVISFGKGITPADILNNPQWQEINAVKTKQVFLEPPPHFGSLKKPVTSCIGTLWVAQKLYPERFTDINVQQEAESFVERFYEVKMTAQFE
ncbi:ABC transporter substrate-binding protein [bacterium]|nr:ABC transporter substrate-binding protein [bacterium]